MCVFSIYIIIFVVWANIVEGLLCNRGETGSGRTTPVERGQLRRKASSKRVKAQKGQDRNAEAQAKQRNVSHGNMWRGNREKAKGGKWETEGKQVRATGSSGEGRTGRLAEKKSEARGGACSEKQARGRETGTRQGLSRR